MKHRLKDGLLMAGVAFVAIVMLIVMSSTRHETDVTYNSLDYQAVLEDDGDLRVTQTIDITLKSRDDGYHQIYQRYNLDPKNLTGITDITVEDLDTGEHYTQTEPINPDDIDKYSDERWDEDKAGTWYMTGLDWSGPVNNLDVQQPDMNDPKELLGADTNSTHNDREQVEIGWNIPVTDSMEHGRFRIGMTLKNITTGFQDSVGFQWEPIGAMNDTTIKQLTGTITMPTDMQSKDGTLKSWMHYAGDGSLSLDGNTIKFKADSINPGETVDIVALGKGTTVTSARHVNEPGFNKVIDVENTMESEWNKKTKTKAMMHVTMTLACIIITLVLVYQCVIAFIRGKNAMTYHGGVEYYREAPEESPALAARLYANTSWSWSRGTAFNKNNAMTATIMSLILKGYVKVYPGPMNLYESMDLMNDPDDSIALLASKASSKDLKKTSTLVLTGKAWEWTGRDSGLQPSEKAMLDALKQTSEFMNSKVFDFDMLKKSIKQAKEQAQRTASSESMTARNEIRQLAREWGLFDNACHDEWRNSSLVEPIGHWTAFWFWVLALFSIAVGFQSAHLAVWVLYTMPVSMLSMFAYAFIGTFKKLTDKGQEVTGQVHGLANYMLDFSDFKDRVIMDATLWGEYMVYATAFGISGQVIQQLKQARVDTSMNDGDRYDRHDHSYGSAMTDGAVLYYWTMNDRIDFATTGEWDLGSSINDAIGDFQSNLRQATSSSSVSGGSGGSSFGGSSGGSGGGSFGAR